MHRFAHRCNEVMGHAGAILSRIYEETSSPEIRIGGGRAISVQLCKQVWKACLDGWDEINQIKVLHTAVSPLTSEGFQCTSVQHLTSEELTHKPGISISKSRHTSYR